MSVPASPATWARPAPGPRTAPRDERLHLVIRAQRDLSVLAHSLPDPGQVFDLLASSALAIFDAEGAVAAQPQEDQVVARASVGSSGPPVGHVIPMQGTLAGVALRTLEPQICRDADTDPRTPSDLSRRNRTRSSIIVPLVHDGVAVGLVAALSSSPFAFDDSDLELLGLLADVAAASLHAALRHGRQQTLEARSAAIVEVLAEGLVELDGAGEVVFANRSAQRMLGFTWDPGSGGLFAESGWSFLHEDGSPRSLEELPSSVVLVTGLAQENQVVGAVSPSGQCFWLLVNALPQPGSTGAPGVVTSFTDVTAAREEAAALRTREARWRAAQELTGLAWWTLDVGTGKHEWSPEMFQLVGLMPEPEAPDLAAFLEMIHPEDRPVAMPTQNPDSAFAAGHRAVFRVIHPDASVHYLQAWIDVETDADGAVLRVLGATIDVTDQAEAAAQLAASEQHFRVAFDNAPIGMSMISLAPESMGTYLRINQAFETMIGYTSEELRGRPIMALTHTKDVERDTVNLARLAGSEVPSLAFEKRFIHQDGTIVHAWVTTSVGYDEAGEPLYLVSHAVDMTDRLREQAELRRLALTDHLTGLANRTLLDDRLDQAIARLQRTSGAAAMLLLDVDRFKLVNDSMGHQVGDALLVEMAGRIESVSRADATVARLGGDEFVVLVEGLADPHDVHAIATRLLETLRRPYDLGGSIEPFVATVSLGISVATTAERSHVDLYREADLALYRAKDAGRDQYALFDDELRSRAVARVQSESLLRRALAEDRLLAVFQPMIDLADGSILGAEGLARIIGTDGELVLPAGFIDVAEETGLIVEVDARIFEMVVAEYARLAALPDVSLRRMTTNVSARSLEDPTFIDRLSRSLRWFGVPGSAIRVELTERSLLTTSPVVHDSLERLSALGIHVGLDDFGTGYSALAYLQRFSLQFLKIDRSFVSRLGVSLRDDAVVGAVIDLAHAHDLVVIAEGVETLGQLAALRALGCDRAQGFLMGRPMRSGDLEATLRTDPRW